MTISLLVADDHEVVRLGLANILDGTHVSVSDEATTGEEVLAKVQQNRPSVVLLDVRMKKGDGLHVLGRLKLDYPDLPVLMFSTYDNPTYVARAVALGAAGYILKSDGKERLMQAIETAARGESAWSREELRRVTGALATPRVVSDVEVPLTQRESEVLRQLANGLTNKEIAMALGISYETVKEHVQHILRKIGVSDRTQAAVWAVRKGLV
ncbi:MAG TPA: DNA-binding response regulator [Planctomycetaceae bacterium]|nr:DNA-binding response regulator [Planctomycetaceae bacterium]